MLQIGPLVHAARADRAARHAHGVAVARLFRHERAGRVAHVAQRKVHALERDLLAARQLVEIAHEVLGGMRARADDPETRAAALHGHGEPLFDQVEVLVQRAAEVRQARVVGGEIEFADGFDGCGGGHQADSFSGTADARRPRKDCGSAATTSTSTK
jgi:hypothetical protein